MCKRCEERLRWNRVQWVALPKRKKNTAVQGMELVRVKTYPNECVEWFTGRKVNGGMLGMVNKLNKV